MKKYLEKLADGRELFIETFDAGALGEAEYTAEGVLRRSFRLVEGAIPKGTLGVLEGVAAKADIINRNRRLYSKEVYELATSRAQSGIRSANFLGEVDHPNYQGSLAGAAFRYTSLHMDGDLLKWEAVLLDTEPGRHLKGLLDGGVGVQISTRGYASSTVEKRKLAGVEVPITVIGKDLHFEGIDAVLFASNPAGRVTNATTESAEVADQNNEAQAMKTVAELRAAHADLVAEIESAAREGFVPVSDVAAQVDAAKAEGVEAGKTAALESNDVQALRAAVAAIVESTKAFAPAPAPVSESESATQVVALTSQVATLEAEVKKLTDAAAEAQKEAEKAEQARVAAESAATLKTAISKAVEAVLKDYPHADLVQPKLEAATSVEDVEKLFGEQKDLIESAIARGKVGESKGKGGPADITPPNGTSDAVKEGIKARQRRIAGLSTAK